MKCLYVRLVQGCHSDFQEIPRTYFKKSQDLINIPRKYKQQIRQIINSTYSISVTFRRHHYHHLRYLQKDGEPRDFLLSLFSYFLCIVPLSRSLINVFMDCQVAQVASFLVIDFCQQPIFHSVCFEGICYFCFDTVHL